ncbi:MAG: hypothetical protein ACR2HK_11330 [Gemmatimonadales bacterium]
MTRIRRLFLLLALAAAGACGDDNDLDDANIPNGVDTVTLGALVGTPITTPSGFSIDVGAVRTDRTTDFEFAYNIQTDGQPVFLPRTAIGLPSTTAAPGLQLRNETFGEIVLAGSNGYVTDEPVPIEAGQRYVVRSRVVCSGLAVPKYGKLEVLSFEDRSVTFQVLTNNNCGYKGLEPGLPDQ